MLQPKQPVMVNLVDQQKCENTTSRAEQGYMSWVQLIRTRIQTIEDNHFSCLSLPPEAHREADRQRFDIMPPARRNEQHLAWLQNTLSCQQVGKLRMHLKIWVVDFNLTRVLGETSLIWVQAGRVFGMIQTHILGAHHLR